MKKILIVEDHEDMQVMYRYIFRRMKDVEIAAQTNTAAETLKVFSDVNPDLVIIDIGLPGMDGLELTRRLRNNRPGLKIIISSGHERELYSKKAEEAGADAFVNKGYTPDLMEKVAALLER